MKTAYEEIAAPRRSYAPRSNVVDWLLSECAAGLVLKAGLPPRLAGASPADNAALFASASDRYGSSGATLRTVAKEVCQLIGVDAPRNTPGLLASAFSSATGEAILSQLVNTALTAGFALDDTSQGWTNPTPVRDFRENRRSRLSVSPLLRLPRGAEAEHAAPVAADAEEFTVVRYARQFVVDEQDAVDDDVSAFTDRALILGRSGLATKLDLLYSVVLENPTMADSVALFHSTHSNVSTTASLSATTLDSALASMLKQTEQGVAVGPQPAFLLVPPALLGLAGRLVRDHTPATRSPLRVVAEPRLELGTVDPRDGTTARTGSATTWYLSAADPTPTIAFAHRTPAPEVASWTLGRGRFGVGFRVNWDIAAKPLAWHGLHRATA